MKYVMCLHELQECKIEIDRLLKGFQAPPPQKVIPRNLLELCEGYSPVEIQPKELYRYFDMILDKKFSVDLGDMK